MSMSFPCNICEKPTAQSADPDKWICGACNQGEAVTHRPVKEVIVALREMAADTRLTNDEVRAYFTSAVFHLSQINSPGDGPALNPAFTWEEAKRRNIQAMAEAGVDPSSDYGLMLRGSFLAGWKSRGGDKSAQDINDL